MSDHPKEEESAEAVGAEAVGAWTEIKAGVRAAKAEVSAANAEFKADMEPVIAKAGTDLNTAWANYKENYSKTAMGGLLRYLRDKTTLKEKKKRRPK